MDEKQEMLRCLIGGCAFAPSVSALAKELGFRGKMTFYRLMQGQVKSETVNRIWDLIKGQFCLTDEGLQGVARAFYGARYFGGALVREMNRAYPGWVEQLMWVLTEGCFDCFSGTFKAEMAPVLHDLREDEPDVYWRMVVLVYLSAKHIDAYTYIKKGEAWKIIEQLDRFLLDLYPEKADAHEAACNLMKLNTAPTLWNLVHTCAVLFRYYAESGFRNLATKAMRIFGFGERSYWRMLGSVYGGESEVWLMMEESYGKGTSGYYLALRLKAGKDIETFTLEDALILQFWAVDTEADLPVLQVCRRRGVEQEWCFYCYEYDEEQLLLRFELVPDLGDPLGIPETLQMIDLGHPEGKDEKIWARIMGKWDASRGEEIFQQAKEMISGIIDQTDTYHIEDVVLSKTMFSILVEHQGKRRTFRIPVEKYKFLAEINPSQMLLITTHLSDGDLYADWPELGYSIRLSEFTDG